MRERDLGGLGDWDLVEVVDGEVEDPVAGEPPDGIESVDEGGGGVLFSSFTEQSVPPCPLVVVSSVGAGDGLPPLSSTSGSSLSGASLVTLQAPGEDACAEA
jgi:hypothetical protein